MWSDRLKASNAGTASFASRQGLPPQGTSLSSKYTRRGCSGPDSTTLRPITTVSIPQVSASGSRTSSMRMSRHMAVPGGTDGLRISYTCEGCSGSGPRQCFRNCGICVQRARAPSMACAHADVASRHLPDIILVVVFDVSLTHPHRDPSNDNLLPPRIYVKKIQSRRGTGVN